MKALFIAFLAVSILSGALYAEQRNFTPKNAQCVMERDPEAKEPVGAIIETAGVFTGKILSAAEIAITGERKITVVNETGECRIFPFCATTKIADKAFNAVTFNKLEKGEKVKVEYAEEGGSPKAKAVTVEK
jgi:hypothetical protein